MSSVLIREEGKKQRPVFYTNKMRLDVETRYNSLEKMVLSLVVVKKKLQHYFQSHPIIVVTNYLIRKILSNPDLSGRLTKWAIELGINEIKYIPRTAKKGQVIADFLVEIPSFGPLEKELIVLLKEGRNVMES